MPAQVVILRDALAWPGLARRKDGHRHLPIGIGIATAREGATPRLSSLVSRDHVLQATDYIVLVNSRCQLRHRRRSQIVIRSPCDRCLVEYPSSALLQSPRLSPAFVTLSRTPRRSLVPPARACVFRPACPPPSDTIPTPLHRRHARQGQTGHKHTRPA